VFAAIRSAGRGEIWVPRVPSARVTDVAASLIGDREIETVFTGIRPGEKIHEILVSEEESFRTVKRDDYYVIQSHLPEIAGEYTDRSGRGDYSSADAVIEGEALDALLATADLSDPAMAGISPLVS
jgi:UDP-glucose 4-epimerase